MKKIYFTVGPSQIYPTVVGHTHTALTDDIFSLNHRSKEFEAVYKSAVTELKKLLSIPDNYSVFFLSSGTEAMEKIIQNTVERHSFHIVTGTFGDRFYETSKELGKQPDHYVYDPLEVFSADNISIPAEAELIALTHNDTSTGMQIPVEEIYEIGNKNPNALIAVDAVSSIPYMDIDYSKVDCVFFSVQKGFGMPAGLGVVVVSPRAMKKSQILLNKGISTGSYHNFENLDKYAQKHQTPDTPNVFGIYLLSKVLEDFNKIGIETIRSDTENKADLIYSFAQKSKTFSPLVKDFAHQSKTTIVLRVEGGSENILQKLENEGYNVGSGYGENKNDHIRIANFPSHSVDDVENLLDELKSV
jgi:phosphoserine aminotransferase